uniref:PDZ domain-containing protein 8-like n=1 Tax=Sinocyclocheilus anshuiensis TaxID=1608454 RepID=A0A671QGQ0_9TELE
MIYLILISAFSGAIVTLLLQLLLLYRRSPEPIARTVQYVKAVPDPALKDYFSNQQAESTQQQSGVTASTSKQPEAASPKQQETTVPGTETCDFLNAIFLFLFRELRDTPVVRYWITKKIKVEFEEFLQTKTAGRLLEGLSLRDFSLGNSVPVFKTARLMKPVALNEDNMPEELNFEVDLEYNGGFHLAIDVDLVFGKSAYLFVKMTRVAGRLKLQFTRTPFTHWSFSFLEDPLIDFEVKSQFEGRPLPQLTSIIVNQLKRVIKKKHTLPNYKISFINGHLNSMTVDQVSELDLPYSFLLITALFVCANTYSVIVYNVLKYTGTLKLIKMTLFFLSLFTWNLIIIVNPKFLQLHNIFINIIGKSDIVSLCLLQTEVIKGPSGSVGMTFRHVPASDGDTVHVSIETVTPNSPAALADLQRGDRLIAIGGVKVTSSVQVPKLLKQAGERVIVLYERPVRHQVPTVGLGTLQETLGPMEEPSYLHQPGGYEEDPAPITSMDISENRDNDSEFEELIVESKSTAAPVTVDTKEDFLLSVNQSPKKTVANLAKPLGSISPILNRRLNLQSPLKPQPKESPKAPTLKTAETSEPPQRPTVPPPPPPARPPVPPRPHIKPAEEIPNIPATNKQDSAKDKISESSSNTRDSVDEQSLWESSETMYRSRAARWNKASVIHEVESHHKFLNVALWCKDPFKLGSLLCLGHVSLRLEHIALECLTTSSAEYQSTFRLCAPEPRASISRTALRSLSTHKGFNEKLCYGDVTLNFTYLADGESDLSSGLVEREREGSLQEEDLKDREKERDGMQIGEMRHNFQDTQFQNPTWCEYCKKKVWTKAASQCMTCSYVCHKKCQEKCLTEHPYCVAASDRRGADPEAKSTINRATTGLTRHIINTSSRLLNLRQVPKARLAEQVAEMGPGVMEPSPKHTPNTSDNESSDTETYAGASPSKQPPGSGGSKLVRKEGGLDDSVFIAVKEIGRDLYRGLPTDERSQKLEFMLDKLQQEIDQELEHNNSLSVEERETIDSRRKALILAALAKSGERLQALTLLMIHYRAGIEDLESVESTSPSEQHGFPKAKAEGLVEALMGTEVYDSDICIVYQFVFFLHFNFLNKYFSPSLVLGYCFRGQNHL